MEGLRGGEAEGQHWEGEASRCARRTRASEAERQRGREPGGFPPDIYIYIYIYITLSAADVHNTGTHQICDARHASVYGADEHGGLLCMLII